MKNILKKLKKWLISLNLSAFLETYVEDIFIFGGLGFITYATFLWSDISGFYCLGICLLGLGVFTYSHPKRKE